MDEAIRNLIADRRMDDAGALALRRNLAQHFEDALVENYRPFVNQMQNHPKDRHVAACAVAGGASLIVTSNIKDFDRLPDGVEAISPDAFLLRLLEETPQQLRQALAAQSARLRRPPMDVPAILNLLRVVTPGFVSAFCAD